MLCRFSPSPGTGGLQLLYPRPSAALAGPAAALLIVAAATCAAAPWTRLAAQAPAPVITPTSGLVTIESDRQMADNSTGIVTALGNVRIVYPDQRVVATGRQAQYFSREGRVVLTGDVDVIQADGHSLRAEQVVYLVDQERLEARPAIGQQVVSRYNLAAPPPGSRAIGSPQ